MAENYYLPLHGQEHTVIFSSPLLVQGLFFCYPLTSSLLLLPAMRDFLAIVLLKVELRGKKNFIIRHMQQS